MTRFEGAFEKKRYIKIAITSISIILIVLYFKVFFTKGIYFNNTFMKKEIIASDIHYIGKDENGGIHITVKGKKNVHNSSEVNFRLPGNLNLNYTVNFIDKDNWDTGIDNIVDTNNKVLFEGGYNSKKNILLLDNKRPYFEDTYSTRSLNVGDKTYRVSIKIVADLAYGSNEVIRGNSGLLFLAIFILVITFIDYKYPLLFFTLKYYMSVEDPKPSEYYIATQRASWVILPIIAVILLIVAI